jgi:hypothetical protein
MEIPSELASQIEETPDFQLKRKEKSAPVEVLSPNIGSLPLNWGILY